MFLHVANLSKIESSPIKNTSWTAKGEFRWIHGPFTFFLCFFFKFLTLSTKIQSKMSSENFFGSPTIWKLLLHFWVGGPCGTEIPGLLVPSLMFGPARKWNPNSSTCLWVACRWSLEVLSEGGYLLLDQCRHIPILITIAGIISVVLLFFEYTFEVGYLLETGLDKRSV